jgi:8-oxo-dGTP pyrophosphatase MutT (NUDIX family)
MNSSAKNPWTVLNTQTTYETPWIKVVNHEVLNAAGNNGIYGTVHFKNYAIGIVALDEDLNTWIVGQFRFPFNAYSWEIPEGGGPIDLSPLDSAKRELLEEVGLTANKWTLIQTMQLSNSATDEVAFLYVAQELSYQTAQPDEGEILQVQKIPFAQLYQLVKSGEIIDSLSVAAVLKVKLMLTDGEL